MKKYKEEKSIDMLKILVLVNNKNEQYILQNEYIITLKTNMVEEQKSRI